MKFNLKLWNEMRLELEAQIKATKNSIRRIEKPVMGWMKIGIHTEGRDAGKDKFGYAPTGSMYRGGTCDEYFSLGNAKAGATGLYALRAALRNKEHSKSIAKEDIIAQQLQHFTLPDDEEKAA